MKKIVTNTSFEAYLRTIELIKKRLINSKNDLNNRHIIVVPDQFLATVRLGVYTDIVSNREKIKVTSFEDMANEFLTSSKFKFISKENSILLLNKCIYNLTKRNRISFFANTYKFESFSEILYSTIKSLIESGITVDDIKAIEEKIPTKLKNKLNEIYLIYQLYVDEMSDNYLDSITVMEALAEELSSGIENTDFYILDFFGLNRQQLKIIKKIEENALSCTIAFSNSFNKPNSYIYQNKIYDQIRKYVEEKNEWGNIKYSNENLSEDIQHASDYIFSYKILNKKIKSERIKLFEFSDIDLEIKNIALDIVEGVQNGKRYKDFQIFCCDMGKYQYAIEKVFTKFKIPFHADVKYKLRDQGKVKFLIDALNVINSNFDKDETIKFVYNPLFSPDFYTFTENLKEKTSKMLGNFEKYVKENYISGVGDKRSFKNKFIPKPNISDQDKIIIEDAELIRDKIYKILTSINAKKQSISSWVETLQELSINSGLNSTWEIFIKEIAKIDLEYQRVSVQVDKKLEDIYLVMKGINDFECNLDEFIFIFKGVISCVNISTIPASIDRVHVGSFNSRFVTSDNLYLIGADSNSIPKTTPEGIIITLNDEKTLSRVFQDSKGIFIQDSQTNMTYNMISIVEFIKKAREKFVISCTSNEKSECSIIYKQLMNLFDNLEIEKPNFSLKATLKMNNKAKYIFLNNETIINTFADNINEWNNLSEENKKDILEKIQIDQSKFEQKNQLPNNINHDYTLVKPFVFSPTLIENYSQCPYMYYLSSLVGIKKEFKFSDSENTERILRGNLCHKYLELFISDFMKNQIKSLQALENRFETFYVKEAEKVIPDFLDEIGRFKVMKEITRDAIKHVIKDMYLSLSSEYCPDKPYKVETNLKDDTDFNIKSLVVGSDESCNFQNEILISGRVDRIDVSKNEIDGEKYYSIYDYKTSNKDFKTDTLKDLLSNGKQIQLPFYMLALEETGHKVGKIAYINVKNSYRTNPTNSYEEKKIIMKDYYNKINKNNGDNKETKRIVNKDQLIEATKNEINSKVNLIKRGVISPTYEQCKENSFCEYRNICKYCSMFKNKVIDNE